MENNDIMDRPYPVQGMDVKRARFHVVGLLYMVISEIHTEV